MRRRVYKRIAALLIFMLLLSAGGCGQKQKEEQPEKEEGAYEIYYINKSDTAVVTDYYEPEGRETEELLEELLKLLQSKPEQAERKAAIPEAVTLLDYTLDGGQLSLYFDGAYLEMDRIYEILCRSAIVRTLCQIPEIEYISFFIGDMPLMDSNQTPIGPLNEESFVENMGDQINTYTVATLNLYFSNKTGDKLVDEKVDIHYSSNMSIEKLVVEQLIKGPITEEAYPSIPPETKIISISTKNGICYVNLDSGFLSQGYDVLETIPIYSIVNSLTEIPGINKVQILINGETDLVYRESIQFETLFERNLDLIEE